MEKTLDLSIKDIDKKKDMLETIIIYLLCLIIPAFLEKLLLIFISKDSIIINNIQIIVGSVVNTLLFISAYNLKGIKKIIGICTMPSISTILSGYLFGINAVSIYMIPFIWIGNFILIYLIKYLMIKKSINKTLSSIISIITKASIIFIGFIIITRFINLPNKKYDILLKSMSYMQVITAVIGFVISNIILKVSRK